MTRRLPLVVVAALLVLAPFATAATALKVTLSAPGHTPRIGKRWAYSIHATSGGKPVAARLTAQIVDPLGGTHPVDYGTSRKPLVNWPFRGVFRDFVLWTADSRGIPLTFRVTVVAGKQRKVIEYGVTPRS